MHIIIIMKKFLAAAFLVMATLPLNAEMAMWYTPSDPGFTTETGTFFSADAYEALSDTIPLGSSASLSTDTGETVVTITGKLPELPPGRTLALTEAAVDALGLSNGTGDVNVSILHEGTIEKDEGNTGWYTYSAGTYSNGQDAYKAYRSLMDNGLKPYAETNDGVINLSVRHIVAFRRAETERLLAQSGIENAQAVMESNPYN